MTDSTRGNKLAGLTLFSGDLNPQLAHVYAQLPGAGEAALQPQRGLPTGLLRGTIQGPFSQLTRTLPAKVPFRDMGPGASRLARAVVPDPCFWAMGEPYLYTVHLEYVVQQRVVAEESRCFGMRMLGVHDNQLYRESAPWQLIGARASEAPATTWQDWRNAGMTKRVKDPDDACCEQASQQGVMLIADLHDGVTEDPQQIAHTLQRLSKYAAVAIVTMPATAKITQPLRDNVPNLLLAQRHTLHRAPTHPVPTHPVPTQPVPIATWADLLLLECSSESAAQLQQSLVHTLTDCKLPVILQQTERNGMSPEQAGERCHRLIAELQPVTEIAGCLA